MFPKELEHQVISQPDYPVVQTAQGKLRGIETEGTFIFRGVPYAQAKRFQMPQPPARWEGIRNARSYGATCAEVSTLIPADGYTVPHMVYPQSENCHFLNIWTQSITPGTARPVMVWVHGGGYQHGSGIEIFSYDGENLSRFGDVVVVTLNHRLHALGYMDLSGYDPERYRYTGNLGTADIVAALKWIHDNIAAFGGDPDNVMVFGQSGGAGKVQMLLQTPAADGLYHKVGLHSGAESAARQELSSADARCIADYVVNALGLTRETIHEIEEIPFYKLAWAVCQARDAYQQEQHKRLNWQPVADGDYYLGNGVIHGFRPETKDIPMLIGNVFGEFENNTIDPLRGEYGPKCEWDAATVEKRLEMRLGQGKDQAVRLFRQAYPDMPVVNAMFTSTQMRENHVDVARARAAFGSTVYNWLLTLELPADGGSTPWHNADESFVFHNSDTLESTFIPGVTDKLDDQMAGAWVAFARTGDPNHPGIPTWNKVDGGPMETMRFDRTCQMLRGHDEEFVRFMNGLHLDDKRAKGPELAYGGGPRNPDRR